MRSRTPPYAPALKGEAMNGITKASISSKVLAGMLESITLSTTGHVLAIALDRQELLASADHTPIRRQASLLDHPRNSATAFDLDLARGYGPRNVPRSADEEPLANDKLALELATDVGLLDRGSPLEIPG